MRSSFLLLPDNRAEKKNFTDDADERDVLQISMMVDQRNRIARAYKIYFSLYILSLYIAKDPLQFKDGLRDGASREMIRRGHDEFQDHKFVFVRIT